MGAGAKTRLESRIKKFTPHFVCRYSVTLVNARLDDESPPVSTDTLCHSGMAIVRYNDKQLLARHNYYDALETARLEYVAAFVLDDASLDVEHIMNSSPTLLDVTPVIDISRHRASTIELIN